MGNWNISIRGLGSHHNGSEHDAEQIAAKCVDALKASGHNIISAEVTYGGAEVLHDGLYGGALPQSRSLMKLISAAGAALVLALVLLPFVAFAQTPAAPAASPFAGLLEQFLSPSGIASIVGALAAFVFGIWKLSDLRKKQVATGAYYAFHMVEDLAATTENTIDDKVAAGLKALDSYMLAQGWRPLKPGEQEVAKLTFSAMHGAQKVAEGKVSPPPVA